jgi:nitrile hydratase
MPHRPIDQRRADAHDRGHEAVPSDPALRVKALESLLVEKGLVDPAALDELVDLYENEVGPRNGAQVVARARVDPEFKRRLLADGTAAIAELGVLGSARREAHGRREHAGGP